MKLISKLKNVTYIFVVVVSGFLLSGCASSLDDGPWLLYKDNVRGDGQGGNYNTNTSLGEYPTKDTCLSEKVKLEMQLSEEEWPTGTPYHCGRGCEMSGDEYWCDYSCGVQCVNYETFEVE